MICKRATARKKYQWNHAITIPEYLQTIFHTVILSFNPM